MKAKSVKISYKSYDYLKQYSIDNKTTLTSIIDATVLFVKTNHLSYFQLLVKEPMLPITGDISARLDSIDRSILDLKRGQIDPIFRTIPRTERAVDNLLQIIEINNQMEFLPPNLEPRNESLDEAVNSDFIFNLKKSKEVAELRLDEAVESLTSILNKMVSTSSGYKRAFTQDEIDKISNFIGKCSGRKPI